MTPTGADAQTAPAARSIDGLCPTESVPAGEFTDVGSDNVHDLAIRCAGWRQVARGRTGSLYAPGDAVTRGQMASFLTRLIRQTGATLPSGSDAFGDDDASVHEDSINALAAAGVVQGRSSASYSPDQVVPRDQMATFLVRTVEYVDAALPDAADYFDDDAASSHHRNINKAAAHGLTGGVGGARYNPSGWVQRDQMASFLMRTLDLIGAKLPSGPVDAPSPDNRDNAPSVQITRVEPDYGDSHGQLEVRVVGEGFDDDTTVTFGASRSGPVEVRDDGTLLVTTTPRADELWTDRDIEQDVCVDVTVTNANANGGRAVADDAYCIFYLAEPLLPRVSSASPNAGPEAGGTVITVRDSGQPGEGFHEGATVWFSFDCTNGDPACEPLVEADVQFISRHELRITTPPGSGTARWEIDQADYGFDAIEFTYGL